MTIMTTTMMKYRAHRSLESQPEIEGRPEIEGQPEAEGQRAAESQLMTMTMKKQQEVEGRPKTEGRLEAEDRLMTTTTKKQQEVEGRPETEGRLKAEGRLMTTTTKKRPEIEGRREAEGQNFSNPNTSAHLNQNLTDMQINLSVTSIMSAILKVKLTTCFHEFSEHKSTSFKFKFFDTIELTNLLNARYCTPYICYHQKHILQTY